MKKTTARPLLISLTVIALGLGAAVGLERLALAQAHDDAVADAGVDAQRVHIIPPPSEELGKVSQPAAASDGSDASPAPAAPVAAPAAPKAEQLPLPSADNPTGTLAQLITFARTGKGRLAFGAGIVLLVWLLRSVVFKRVPWLQTKTGGYLFGFGTTAILYVGGGLLADLPITFNLIADALSVGFASGGKWEAALDMAGAMRAHAANVAKVGLVVLTFAVLLGSSCKPYVPPTFAPVADCVNAERDKIDPLIASFWPKDGGAPDWGSIKDQAIADATDIAICAAGEFIQQYLAPKPGNAAPPPEVSRTARDTFEEIRKAHGGQHLKTKYGTL